MIYDPNSQDTILICSICLESIDDENVCTTNCNHTFCKQCLDTWFDQKRLSCPMCRGNIQYFNHKEVSNRVVCIVKTEPLRVNPNLPLRGPTVIIYRRSFIVLYSMASLFLLATCILGSLWASCRDYY